MLAGEGEAAVLCGSLNWTVGCWIWGLENWSGLEDAVPKAREEVVLGVEMGVLYCGAGWTWALSLIDVVTGEPNWSGVWDITVEGAEEVGAKENCRVEVDFEVVTADVVVVAKLKAGKLPRGWVPNKDGVDDLGGINEEVVVCKPKIDGNWPVLLTAGVEAKNPPGPKENPLEFNAVAPLKINTELMKNLSLKQENVNQYKKLFSFCRYSGSSSWWNEG